jgi:hypothetical protein
MRSLKDRIAELKNDINSQFPGNSVVDLKLHQLDEAIAELENPGQAANTRSRQDQAGVLARPGFDQAGRPLSPDPNPPRPAYDASGNPMRADRNPTLDQAGNPVRPPFGAAGYPNPGTPGYNSGSPNPGEPGYNPGAPNPGAPGYNAGYPNQNPGQPGNQNPNPGQAGYPNQNPNPNPGSRPATGTGPMAPGFPKTLADSTPAKRGNLIVDNPGEENAARASGFTKQI